MDALPASFLFASFGIAQMAKSIEEKLADGTPEPMVPLSEVQKMIDAAIGRAILSQGGTPKADAPITIGEATTKRLAELTDEAAMVEATLIEGEYKFEVSKPGEGRMTRIVGADGGSGKGQSRVETAKQMALAKYRNYFGIRSEDENVSARAELKSKAA